MQQISVFKTPQGKAAILEAYEKLLQFWPVPYEAKHCETRHGETFVIACGDESNPPLILLHGSSFNSAMWLGDAADYAKHFRVYAVDLPGEPGKSTEYRPDLTTQAFAEWMEDVMHTLGIEKASFAGISLGGWAILKFATAHPDRVDKLVLLCPAGIGRQKVSFLLRMLPLQFLGEYGQIRAIQIVMGTKDILPEAVAYSRLINANFLPYMQAIPLFGDEELKRLTCPVLVIGGDKDVILRMDETIARTKRLLPHANAVLLKGVGHGLIDQKARILEFLCT